LPWIGRFFPKSAMNRRPILWLVNALVGSATLVLQIDETSNSAYERRQHIARRGETPACFNHVVRRQRGRVSMVDRYGQGSLGAPAGFHQDLVVVDWKVIVQQCQPESIDCSMVYQRGRESPRDRLVWTERPDRS
jgi:hypothetical protein